LISSVQLVVTVLYNVNQYGDTLMGNNHLT